VHAARLNRDVSVNVIMNDSTIKMSLNKIPQILALQNLPEWMMMMMMSIVSSSIVFFGSSCFLFHEDALLQQ
jgi:hypothetical protein